MMKQFFLPLALILCLLGVGGVVLWQSQRADTAERALEEVYQSALFETAEQMQSLSLALEKLLVTADPAQGAALLQRISQLSDTVRRDLTLLPLSHDAMSATLVFANQLSEYAASLLPVLVEQGALPTEDETQLSALWTDCASLSGQMAIARDTLATQQLALSASGSLFFAEPAASARPLEILGDADHGMDYPTMIYDGAFSDARREGTPKGLPGGEVTQEEALALAMDFVGRDRALSAAAAPQTGGIIPAWGVTVQTEGLQLDVEVTQQGGVVLWMMPETAAFAGQLTYEDCEAKAAAFLLDRGFADMTPTHHQFYEDGLCLINYAARSGDVLLYPDLIKVQVRTDTGAVVGFEANNYWMNHTARSLPAAAISRAQAQAALSPSLTVTDSRLCVIPLLAGEVLCWEFACTRGDGQYLLYVNAATGREAEILKLIPTAAGTLTA